MRRVGPVLVALLCALASAPSPARAQQGFACGAPASTASPQGFVCNLFQPYMTVSTTAPAVISANPDTLAASVTAPSGTLLWLLGADASPGGVLLDTFGTTANPLLIQRHARGTAAVPAALVSQDVLGQLSFRGYNGTTYAVPALIVARAAQNFSSSANGSQIEFYTDMNGSAGNSLSMEVTQLGTLNFPQTKGGPAVSACGSTPAGSADAVATTNSGTVTAGGGVLTSCTVTFNQAFTTSDHCQVAPETTTAAFAYTYTLSAITVTATSLTGIVFDYHCDGI